jgi:hypothetical protein
MAGYPAGGSPIDQPYRGPAAGRPQGIPLPPDPMPLFRHWHLRKRWHYVTLWSSELIACANVAKVGPLRQEYWAVWDRTRKRLWKGSHAFRHRVDPKPGRLVVGDRDVAIDVTLGPLESFEAYRPEGSVYIWGRKDYGEYGSGTIRLGEESRRFEGAVFVDFSAGYYARRTKWRWMAGSGTDKQGGRVSWTGIVGLLDTPQSSERTFWAAAPGVEIGPVVFSDDLTEMTFAEGGSIVFEEEAVLSIRRNFLIIRSDYAHAFGKYSGTLPGGIEMPEGYGVRERFDGLW